MDQRVHVELHLVAVVVNLFKQRVKLVDRVNAVGLARSLGPAAAADRRLEQGVGVGVAGGKVKLELGRHDGLQAFGGKQVADLAQHAARGKGNQIASVVKTVMDDLRRGVGGPGHDAHRGRVRAQLHVLVGRVNHVVVGAAFRKLTRHAHGHNGLRQAHAPVFGKFGARQDFSPGHAGQVGYQAFDFGHAALVKPLLEVVESHGFLFRHGLHPPVLLHAAWCNFSIDKVPFCTCFCLRF